MAIETPQSIKREDAEERHIIASEMKKTRAKKGTLKERALETALAVLVGAGISAPLKSAAQEIPEKNSVAVSEKFGKGKSDTIFEEDVRRIQQDFNFLNNIEKTESLLQELRDENIAVVFEEKTGVLISQLGVALANQKILERFLVAMQEPGVLTFETRLSEELARKKIDAFDRRSVYEFLQLRLPSLEFVKRISPAIRKVAIPHAFTLPRYYICFSAHHDTVKKEIALQITSYDAQSGSLGITHNPIVVSTEDPPDKKDIIRNMAKIIIDMNTAISKKIDISSEKKSSLPRVEEKEPKEGYCIAQSGIPFTEKEKVILQEIEDDAYYINISFMINHKQESLKIKPSQLALLGKIRCSSIEMIYLTFEREYGGNEYKSAWHLYDLLRKCESDRGGDINDALNKKELWTIDLRVNQDVVVRIGSVDRNRLGRVSYETKGAYHYYEFYDTDSDSAFSAYRDPERFAHGVSSIEKDFGFVPGERIKRIIVDRLQPYSGGWFFSEADTVAVGADKMLLNEKSDEENTGRHEAIHALSYAFRVFRIPPLFLSKVWTDDLREKYRAQTDYRGYFLYLEQMHRGFLNQLAEGELNRYNPKINLRSGHPTDNEEEFFASLVNSLYVQQPEKVFREKDVIFLKLYEEALLKTIERFRSIPKLQHAPVMEKLKMRQLLVQRIIKEKGAEEKRKFLTK